MRVAVGMSGGVDSAVAALLLQREGHDVVGVTSLNYQESRCCDTRSVMEAKRIAEQLGIPYHTLDVIRPFRAHVVDAFVEGYRQGFTPNPCTICNATVRFEELFEEAEWRFEVEAIATGHYARVEPDPATGRHRLLRGADPRKDQAYMLSRLNQAQLARVRFPLGGLHKEETRAIAREAGLSVAQKPDSQDVCFVMGDPRGFLERELGSTQRPGPIRHVDGTVLGTHEGTAYYTVGQRRGLGIAHPEPLYVVRIDAPGNTVVVGPRPAALVEELRVEDVNWVAVAPQEAPFRAEVQIRYRSAPAWATVTPSETGLAIAFDEAQFAAAPGQVAACYAGDVLMASGIIARR